MAHLAHRPWLKAFFAVAFVVLLQIAWWTTVFLTDVEKMSALSLENNQLRVELHEPVTVSEAEIHENAFHRRLMFISESVVFGFLTIVGLFILYAALNAEGKAAHLQKSFIEVVTHESKTPLTALKLRIESILEKWRGTPDLERELEATLLEVRRLSSTFETVLTLNRVERKAFHFELVDLREIALSVLRRLEPLAKASQVQVQTKMEQCFVTADVSSLQSAVQGLVENAIYHQSGNSRKVDVELAQNGEDVVLSVQDYGEQIPAGERSRIFEKFFRGHKGRKVPGSGLGLSIAKQIVDAHRGLLRLAENSPSGNRFELILKGANA